MKITNIAKAASLALVISFGTATSVLAVDTASVNEAATQNDAEEVTPLTYRATMTCAAFSTFMGVSFETDNPDASEKFYDLGARWLTLAYARDGEDGSKAEKEYEPILKALVEKFDSFGEDEAGQETFIVGISEKCGALKKQHQTELDAIVVEE